jgi:hypothetical protein
MLVTSSRSNDKTFVPFNESDKLRVEVVDELENTVQVIN